MPLMRIGVSVVETVDRWSCFPMSIGIGVVQLTPASMFLVGIQDHVINWHCCWCFHISITDGGTNCASLLSDWFLFCMHRYLNGLIATDMYGHCVWS